MKKTFFKMSIVAALFTFAACSSDDGGSKSGGANAGSEECAGLKAAATAAKTQFEAGTIDCETALMAIEAAWDAECYSDNEAVSMAQSLPCFDINNYN